MALSPDQEQALKILTPLLIGKKSHATAAAYVLTGPAGSGKTTLMRQLIQQFKASQTPFRLLAPTGRAAINLRNVTGEAASTIHKFLYAGANESKSCPECGMQSKVLQNTKGRVYSDPCEHCGAFFEVSDLQDREAGLVFSAGRFLKHLRDMVVIVDEASMVGRHTFDTLQAALDSSCRVLYVGDPAQLPPIGEKGTTGLWGPPLNVPTARLTTIHRQKEAPILDLATRIRTGVNKAGSWFSYTAEDPPAGSTLKRVRMQAKTNIPKIAAWMAEARKKNADAAIICYSNERRHALNVAIRHARGFTADQPIWVGDRLLVRSSKSTLGRATGEILEVTCVHPSRSLAFTQAGFQILTVRIGQESQQITIHVPSMQSDRTQWLNQTNPYTEPYARAIKVKAGVGARVATLSTADLFDHFQMVRPDNLLHVDFGEVITCHSAQGSQWEHVGLVWDSTARFMLAKDLTNGTAWLYTAVTRAKTTFTVFDL